MAKKDDKEFNDPKKPNLKVLREFRLGGKPVGVGAVLAKSDFDSFGGKGAWQNLVNMVGPKLEETADEVQDAPKSKKPDNDSDDGKSPGGLPGTKK